MGGRGSHRAGPADAPVSFVDVLRIRVFAVLYLAETQSIAGDQLARVALSVLVFDQTGSAPATALTYAVTFLPAVLGGVLLGQIGDRFPRRWVMVWSEGVRALCFAVMALAGLPLLALIALAVFAVFLGPAFSAAQVSYLSSRLPYDEFRVANALRLISSQGAQVAGFAVGGLIVAVLAPRGALLVDAGTFVASGLLIATLCRDPPGPAGRSLVVRSPEGDAADAQKHRFDGLWNDHRLRALVALSLLIGFFVVPEGLAVPYGRSIDASTSQIGLLLAAGALGGALGALLLVRSVPQSRRGSVANWMAVGCGLPLVLSGVTTDWRIAGGAWLLSGVLAAYIVETSTVVVQAIPDSRRSQLVGVIGAFVLGAQGAGVIVFGAMTEVMTPGHAIAAAGVTGSALALLMVLGPLRRARLVQEPDRGEVPARHGGANA